MIESTVAKAAPTKGGRFAIELVLLGVAVLFLLPVVLIYVTSFKPQTEIIHFHGLWPQHPTTEHMRHVLTTPEDAPVFRWLLNSIMVSTCTTGLVLAVTSMAAYGIARLHLPGAKAIFAVIIATMMIPGQILLVPMYMILTKLGWIDTPLALIVPAGAGAFGVFLLHQFFKAVPKELEEAAELDGCDRWQTFWHVMLPQARPAMATLAILTFIGSWNEFLGPLVFLDSIDRYTLPVGVALFQGSYNIEYGLTFAASVVCTTPILILFLLFQKQIVRAVSFGGGKE